MVTSAAQLLTRICDGPPTSEDLKICDTRPTTKVAEIAVASKRLEKSLPPILRSRGNAIASVGSGDSNLASCTPYQVLGVMSGGRGERTRACIGTHTFPPTCTKKPHRTHQKHCLLDLR